MSIEQFDAAVDAAVMAVEEAETLHDGFWDKQMETRQGIRPSSQAPSWDLATARRYAVQYFEVAPGPNDAHVGIPRWV